MILLEGCPLRPTSMRVPAEAKKSYSGSMRLREGQQVLIKNPRPLTGTVIHRRPGDADLPEDEARYLVKISEERYYVSTDLQTAEESDRPLKPYGPEYNEELRRMDKALQKWLANNSDRAAWDAVVESGSKVGWFVPAQDKTK